MQQPSRLIATLSILLSTILLGCGVNAQNQTVCDLQLLVQCQANFNDYLNLQGGSTWLNPEQFRRDVEDFYQYGGVGGLLKVCRAFRAFKGCLGGQYSLCLSIPTFVLNSVKPQPAYEFVKVFTQFHFICGAGLNLYLNNDDCMSRVWATQQQTLTNCRHKFDSDSAFDPTNACLYASDALSCYEVPFLLGCPTQRGPSWWACEYERIGTAINYPQCNLRCAIPSVGGNVG